MTDILAQICADKLTHVASQKQRISEKILLEQAQNAPSPAGFHNALRRKVAAKETALITEIKKASPSRGLIRADFDPVAIASAYHAGGATCLSILTDTPYFQGSDAYLQQVRSTISLPILRKDFMLDPYQIIESRTLGADCILLIMAALGDAQAKELETTAHELGMDVLIEVHNAEELERALQLTSPLLGINNRNLKTLEISLTVTEELHKLVPDHYTLVCESGIHSRADIERMEQLGIYSFLVGESLMKQQNIESAVKNLLSY
jgi:indole-3-glycerol phosphate synthase